MWIFHNSRLLTKKSHCVEYYYTSPAKASRPTIGNSTCLNSTPSSSPRPSAESRYTRLTREMWSLSHTPKRRITTKYLRKTSNSSRSFCFSPNPSNLSQHLDFNSSIWQNKSSTWTKHSTPTWTREQIARAWSAIPASKMPVMSAWARIFVKDVKALQKSPRN